MPESIKSNRPVSELAKEIFARWYPHDEPPTATEWNSVPAHLSPTKAVQLIKRARMNQTKDNAVTRHPTIEEVAAVSRYKSSLDHLREIQQAKETENASTLQRRRNASQSTDSAPRNISNTGNRKAKRKRRK